MLLRDLEARTVAVTAFPGFPDRLLVKDAEGHFTAVSVQSFISRVVTEMTTSERRDTND